MGGTLAIATSARVIAPGPLPGHRVLSTVLRNEGDEPLRLDVSDLVLRDEARRTIPATAVFDRRRSTSGSVTPKNALVAPGKTVAVVIAWRLSNSYGEAVALEHPSGELTLS
jgi:hypothetical protein